ncbi:GH25 family lysozyme [Paenibacillus sp. SORGH_AS_0306]|uniref:GH25 family lysozyme n=1 Tax=unclassified Paenibacillus TaxID=185978 RepID=UPI00359357EB
MQEVERSSGRKPIVYTGNAFAQNFSFVLSGYDLWIAHYSNTRVPDDAPVWKAWDFWQYTDSGQVGGINGGCRSERI